MPRHYFKIPYNGHFSGVAQPRVRKPVPDPDFEIRGVGEGGSNPDPQQFSLKIRAPRGPSQDPPLQTHQRIL